jgi:hypothetical protein
MLNLEFSGLIEWNNKQLQPIVFSSSDCQSMCAYIILISNLSTYLLLRVTLLALSISILYPYVGTYFCSKYFCRRS